VAEKLILEGFEPFIGKHCETTALKRAFDYHGLSLSEEMLFGLGGGIGFLYWHTKSIPLPFIGTRNGKVADFTCKACRRIGATVTLAETSSPRRGYEELKSLLRNDEPAIAYVDMVYLPYLNLPESAHFGGHAVLVVGLDENKQEAYIYDRGRKPVTVSIGDLAKSRSSRFPPFPPKHKLLKIRYPAKIRNLEQGIMDSILECCQSMLKPPIKNIGLAGMEKWSKLVAQWPQKFHGINLLGALMNGFIYIETGGTGGSGFRPMYTRFLEEASDIVSKPGLKEVAVLIGESGKIWTGIASAFLPDSWRCLGRIRALLMQKNQLFEEQESSALAKMKEIDAELDQLIVKAGEDLKDPPPFLADVEKRIQECVRIEKQAFEKLSTLMADRLLMAGTG